VRRALQVVIALVALYLYSYFLVFVIGYFLAQPNPAWWDSMFSTRAHAILAWMVLCHSAAVVIVSVPFAYLIHRAYGRYGPLVALGMTLTLFVFFALPAWHYLGDAPTRQKVVTLFDQIKLIGVLPALVWVLSKLPSSQRLERP
jgi:hypothetical protein